MITSWLRDAPLRQKLTVLTMLVSGVSLAVALVAFSVFQVRLSREMAARDLAALAEIVAANAAGPIAFHDRDAAQTTLATLRARSDVVQARLVGPTGDMIAEFSPAENLPAFVAPPAGQPYHIRGARIYVVQPVTFQQEALGALELTADFQPTLARLARAAVGVLLVILACAMLLAYTLTKRWQRILTAPISALADTVRRIAAAQDYSVRAVQHGADEIGGLTDDFNHMLGEIQARDVALSRAKQAASEQVVLLQREVAERQRTENELQVAKNSAEAANRAKSSFLAAMSHEIRTPMNGVLGMSNLLLETALTREQQEFARVIHSSGETLLALLNDILDFSKIEAGRIDFETTDFDLRELIEDTIELQLVAASAKKLDLLIDLDPALPTNVRGDPHRLRQVLTNLLGNAVKFTPAGKVTVQATRVSDDTARTTYRIEVRDTGVGIAPAMQQRLFQPFVQADTSTTRQFGGTGLGLAISKRLVELMHGTIGVESAPGKGSTFWFTVSLARPSPETRPAQWETFGGARALVVADDDETRLKLERQLRLWDVTPEVAASADAALQLVQGQEAPADPPLQLAIIDVSLPESPTLELARQLATTATPHRPRAVIVLSTIDARIPATAWQPHGITECLTKPVRTRVLHQALTCALGGGPAATSAPSHPDALALAPPALAPSAAPPVRALLVEDHLVNQRIARLQLQRLGCAVHVASNGREAISRLVATPYDIVFMDCQMPEMDGYEATRLIRANEKSGIWRERGPAFIVAMTANAMQGDREQCLAAGMDDYIAKPFKPAALVSVLRRVRDAAQAIVPTGGSPNGPLPAA